MKTMHTLRAPLIAGLMALTVLSSCSKNDNGDTPLNKTYKITAYNSTSQISGTLSVREVLHTDSVWLTIQLQGTSTDGSYPVVVRQGTSIEDGPVAFDLGFVDGQNPSLTKEIPMSFSDFMKYNGCVDIYRNPNDLVTIVAQSEVGSNETYKAFDLVDPNQGNGKTINGQFRIYKRRNGAYLVVRVDTSASGMGTGTAHPARVYQSNGQRDFDLNPVADSSGVSATDITDHTFSELSSYSGTLKVLQSDQEQDVVISQGSF
jgi:hypothetical protein